MKTERLVTTSDTAAASLRDTGLRATGPRLAILNLLRHDTTHPTAEQVYQRLRSTHPGLSLSTVYNTLDVFSRHGLCRRVPSEGGSQRFDGTLEPHHHALCVNCGQVFDLPFEVYQPLPAPRRLELGLEVRNIQITFEVTCAACRQHLPGGREATADDRVLE